MMDALIVPRVPRLDLGSGPTPREGYVGVDKCGGDDVHRWNFTNLHPWPFASESIETLHSSHLIEHLPLLDELGRDCLFVFFEEAWRISKPGALFHLRWPVPFHPKTGMPMPSAWFDPTHYRHIPYQQLDYLSTAGRAAMGVESYAVRCNWVLHRDVTIRELTSDGSVLEYDVELRREPR